MSGNLFFAKDPCVIFSTEKVREVPVILGVFLEHSRRSKVEENTDNILIVEGGGNMLSLGGLIKYDLLSEMNANSLRNQDVRSVIFVEDRRNVVRKSSRIQERRRAPSRSLTSLSFSKV